MAVVVLVLVLVWLHTFLAAQCPRCFFPRFPFSPCLPLLGTDMMRCMSLCVVEPQGNLPAIRHHLERAGRSCLQAQLALAKLYEAGLMVLLGPLHHRSRCLVFDAWCDVWYCVVLLPDTKALSIKSCQVAWYPLVTSTPPSSTCTTGCGTTTDRHPACSAVHRFSLFVCCSCSCSCSCCVRVRCTSLLQVPSSGC